MQQAQHTPQGQRLCHLLQGQRIFLQDNAQVAVMQQYLLGHLYGHSCVESTCRQAVMINLTEGHS